MMEYGHHLISEDLIMKMFKMKHLGQKSNKLLIN